VRALPFAVRQASQRLRPAHLLDHLVGAGEQCAQGGEAKRLGSLEINHSANFVGCWTASFGRLCILQNDDVERGARDRQRNNRGSRPGLRPRDQRACDSPGFSCLIRSAAEKVPFVAPELQRSHARIRVTELAGAFLWCVAGLYAKRSVSSPGRSMSQPAAGNGSTAGARRSGSNSGLCGRRGRSETQESHPRTATRAHRPATTSRPPHRRALPGRRSHERCPPFLQRTFGHVHAVALPTLSSAQAPRRHPRWSGRRLILTGSSDCNNSTRRLTFGCRPRSNHFQALAHSLRI